MRFTLRQIEVFVAIARGENVSRAAEALSLSQSATSAALADLEHQFDRPLFDRVGKRLRLNEHGRLLLPQAVELLDRAQELEARLREDDTPGSLKVGATLTIGNYLAPLIMADYLQQHPTGQVALTVHNTTTILAQVARYEIDLGLIEGRADDPEVEVEPWVEDELVPFCAPTHPLAGHKTVSLDELTPEWWILRERGSGTRETLERALRHRPEGLRVRLELEHTEAVKRAVENGLGIGCISRLALRDAFRRGSLVPLEVPGLDLSRRFQFAWHRGKYHTAAIRAFLAACRRMTAGARRSHEIALPPVK
ncbi:LysR family transcriptional regulator [Thauera sp. CAU 1555]|uniref:LysR family transcriptional regulator n=1 Tax=Thauera sedimentorum TaxID=2767595 RepID=A0ABR9B8G1_9RHOO|nr:LysR family transcriptional regulator [Thauera sedimentorum]MBC9071701.1 LysR family transcriptional regulator [Thauera sedimentorum]MBD8502620.1 LysR family transcriptional regulator [Thauera sedimentorum]